MTGKKFWTICEPELNSSEWKTYLNFYKYDLSLLKGNILNNTTVFDYGDIMSTGYVSKLGKKIKHKLLKEGIMSMPKENCILLFNISINYKKTKNDINKTRKVYSIIGNMPVLANRNEIPYGFFGILLPVKEYIYINNKGSCESWWWLYDSCKSW